MVTLHAGTHGPPAAAATAPRSLQSAAGVPAGVAQPVKRLLVDVRVVGELQQRQTPPRQPSTRSGEGQRRPHQPWQQHDQLPHKQQQVPAHSTHHQQRIVSKVDRPRTANAWGRQQPGRLQDCQDWHALAAWLSGQAFTQPKGHQHTQRDKAAAAEGVQHSWWDGLNVQKCLHIVRQAVMIAKAAQQQHGKAVTHTAAPGAGAAAPPAELRSLLLQLIASAAARLQPGDAVGAAELLRGLWRLSSYSKHSSGSGSGHPAASNAAATTVFYTSDRGSRKKQSSDHSAMGLTAQEQQVLGQQLLHCMSAQAPGTAAARAPQHPDSISNANLFADVCQAVMQLQLQPDSSWATWSYSTSLRLMQAYQQDRQQQLLLQQQRQQQPWHHPSSKPTSWFLTVTLQLAAYLRQQQHQQRQQQQQEQQQQPAMSAMQQEPPVGLPAAPFSTWLAAWAWATAQLPQPFSTRQLLIVTHVLRQLHLQQQLPGSFWRQHVAAGAVQQLQAQDLLQLLQQLPPRGQHLDSEPLLPSAWLQAAADALPPALTAVAGNIPQTRSSRGLAAGGVVLAVPLQLLQQGTAAVEGLVAAGWQGADQRWCQDMWRAVLGMPLEQGGVSLQQTDTVARHRPLGMLTAVPASADAVTAAAAGSGVGSHDSTSLNNTSSGSSSSSAKTTSSGNTRVGGANAGAASPKHWVCLGRALRGAAAASRQDADLVLQPVAAAAAAIDGVTGKAAAAAAAVPGQAANDTKASNRWPTACNSQASSWVTALQNVLTTSQQVQQSAGDAQGAQPIAGQLGQQHTAQQPPQHHLELPAAVAASLVVALVQLTRDLPSSTAAEPAGPEATSTASPAVDSHTGTLPVAVASWTDGSSSSIRACTHLLLQSLTGQLHQLGLQQLLSLGRALVAPVPWRVPTQGGAASEPHGQQRQQQQQQSGAGPDERQCLLLQAPQLVSEFVHQVAVWAPEASPDELNTALSVVRAMLRATAHIHPCPAAAALGQHQEQREQEQMLLQEPLSRLLGASMQQLWEQQRQQQQQQQQEQQLAWEQRQGHTRWQQHNTRVSQHDQHPAVVLQVQLLLNMLRLYTALAAAGSVAVRACMPSGWWQQWFEAARGPVLAAASLQELLMLCRLLPQAKQDGILSHASPAAAAAAAAAGDEVVWSRSLPATAAAGEHDEQQVTEQLQAWLTSEWLPAMTQQLESKADLSLNVQAGVVRTVVATGIALSGSFVQAWGRSCAASVQHTLAAAAEAADTAAAAAAAECFGADAAASAADAAAAVAAFRILGGCSCCLFAAAADAGLVYPPVWHTAAEQMALAVAATAHAAVTSHQSTRQQQQEQQDHSGLPQQRQQEQRQQAWVQTAAQCVLQFARATQHQAPGSAWMAQLEQQLLPLLQFGNLQSVATVLWAFAAVWRVHPSGAFLQAVLADSQTLLQQSGGTYSSQLRVLLLSLAMLRVQQLPRPWLQAAMQSTGQALIAASTPQRSTPVSSDAALPGATSGTFQQQQHQRRPQQMSSQEAAQSPDFVSDVAWSLAVLGVTPSSAWQQLWQQQVSRTLTCLSPDQVVDCLYAAAVWHTAAKEAAREAAQATARAGVVPADRLPQPPGHLRAAAGQSGYSVDSPGHGINSSGSSSNPDTAANLAQQTSRIASSLLPRPQHRHAAMAARSSGSSGSMPGSFAQGRPSGTAARPAAAAAPPRPWLEALLQELRARFRQCSPKQLTVALWSLGQLGLKAPVDWLDALYDELLQQLPSCSLVQLCQLLQALLHQQHDLAPARVDAVLQAALVRLQVATSVSTQSGKCPAVAVPGAAAAAAVAAGGVSRAPARFATTAGEACSVEVPHAPVDLRLVVWMLQLVVKLKHEPQQQWCAGVATAVQQQLLLLHTQSGQALQHSGSAAGPLPGRDSSSSRGGEGQGPHLAPEVFCELLQHMALLDFDLSGSWTATAEAALRPLLPHCSGEQLAVVLSATTRLHWYQPTAAVPAADAAAGASRSVDEVKLTYMGLRGSRLQSRQVFLTRLLRQLRRHLGSLDPRSLGLVGAAVSQLGLHMQEREWVQPFMAAVKVIAASHIPLSATEVADLQRSVQYLSWKRRTAPWCRSKSSHGRARTAATLSSFSWRCRQHRCRLACTRPRPTACGLQQLRPAARHDTVRRRSQVP